MKLLNKPIKNNNERLTKNIVHLADSARNEYGSNKETYCKTERLERCNAKRTIFKTLEPMVRNDLV